MNIWRSKYCFWLFKLIKIFCSINSLASIASNILAYLSCLEYDEQNILALP